MHVFLTGALQVGKSTVVQKATALTHLALGGFVTFFGPDRQSLSRRLYLCGVGDAVDCAQRHVAAHFEKGKPVPNPACFDHIGVRLLERARADADLIIMDECGRLERDAQAFQRAVLLALDGAKPVLGVVRLDAGGWTGQILTHPKVRIVTVTEENRDALPGALAAHYTSNERGEFLWPRS